MEYKKQVYAEPWKVTIDRRRRPYFKHSHLSRIGEMLRQNVTIRKDVSQHGSFDNNTDFSVLSNPVDATNVSLQGHHGRDIFPQSLDQYGSDTFNLQLLVFIK